MLKLNDIHCLVGRLHSTVGKRRLTGELSLSCARLTAGQVTTLWVNSAD